MKTIALGFRAMREGSVVVGVALEGDAPRVVFSGFLATAEEGDRLAREPFHLAAEMAGGWGTAIPPKAAAAVDEGRRRQEALAQSDLAEMIHGLKEAGWEPVLAALLVNRAGWALSDLLGFGLSAPEHAAVAEGLAVREALHTAFARCGLEAVEMDEKSLREVASVGLGLSPAVVERLGAVVGRPWRKEQKLASLAAWVALARRPGDQLRTD
ncbi:MAG: hypothetical protein ACRED8_13185 [Caulobacteraceae bacterium]